MTALAANANVVTLPPTREKSYIVLSGEEVFANGLVGVNGDGYLVPWADTAGLKWRGLCQEYVLGDGVKRARVDVGGAYLFDVDVSGGSGIASLNDIVHCADDNVATLSTTAGANTRGIGYIDDRRSNDLWTVKLFSAAEYAAFNNFGDAIAALTDNSGGAATDGTIGVVTPPTALAASLTDNTGDSGTHDDTLAAVTLPTAITGDGAGNLGTGNGAFEDQNGAVTGVDGAGSNAASKADVDARLVSIGNNMQELATAQTANLAAITVLRQNSSDTAQKVIELVAAQAQNRTALVALTDAVAELAAKVNEIRAQLAR